MSSASSVFKSLVDTFFPPKQSSWTEPAYRRVLEASLDTSRGTGLFLPLWVFVYALTEPEASHKSDVYENFLLIFCAIWLFLSGVHVCRLLWYSFRILYCFIMYLNGVLFNDRGLSMYRDQDVTQLGSAFFLLCLSSYEYVQSRVGVQTARKLNNSNG